MAAPKGNGPLGPASVLQQRLSRLGHVGRRVLAPSRFGSRVGFYCTISQPREQRVPRPSSEGEASGLVPTTSSTPPSRPRALPGPLASSSSSAYPFPSSHLSPRLLHYGLMFYTRPALVRSDSAIALVSRSSVRPLAPSASL
ncbi:uncharacterized protein PSFLO_03635 [Pseudozyma flocculosa]|uniref:Uncharacterized protein n=1 Tax=Pseudozyma flocculosa TaxID=84751 RepID=A0A5C3F158_9BASI|nr:uncharacterized protein PSFLO_03635 [Pseudozyma flocculosa]